MLGAVDLGRLDAYMAHIKRHAARYSGCWSKIYEAGVKMRSDQMAALRETSRKPQQGQLQLGRLTTMILRDHGMQCGPRPFQHLPFGAVSWKSHAW
eukprot:4800179-Amphidinium_carterae.1